MKKLVLVLVVLACLISGAVISSNYTAKENVSSAYLRIHIRANSNDEIDQGVKYAVKESVVNYLTPKISEVSTLDEAMVIIEGNLSEIENIANNVLKINGFLYFARASLNRENFPTRSYEDLVLSEGIYDALIIELGSAGGDNWWCVIYPPLCFVGKNTEGDKIRYKSFIYELFSE